ncbi:TPA: hypothetical protein ACW7NQ_000991 [Enterobacter ludwigii]
MALISRLGAGFFWSEKMAEGTINLTNNSNALTGDGTKFQSEVTPGDFIYVEAGNVPYTLPVDRVNSDTSITLLRKFSGPSSNGLAWTHIPRRSQNSVYAYLADQVSEAIRLSLNNENNWQKLLTEDGDVTIARPDGSTFTGPSWPYIANIAAVADFDRLKVLADQIHADTKQISEDAKQINADAKQVGRDTELAKGYAESASSYAKEAREISSTVADDVKKVTELAGEAARSAASAKESENLSARDAERAWDAAGETKEYAEVVERSTQHVIQLASEAEGNAASAKESAANAGGYAESASADANKVAELAEAVAVNAADAKESVDSATYQAERAKREADRAEEAANRAESGLPVADVIWDQLGVSGNARKALTKNPLEAADFNAAPAPKEGQFNLDTLFTPGTYHPFTFGGVSLGYPKDYMYCSVRVADAGYKRIIQIIESDDGAVYLRTGQTSDDGKTYSFGEWTGGHSTPVDANQGYRVGSVIMAAIVGNNGSSLQYGQTISGAGLRASSVSLPYWNAGNGVIYSGATLSGSWRHLGHANTSGADDNPVGGNSYPVSLFIRIL